MLVLHVVATILGAALVLSTLLSAIKTVILPRSAGSLVTRAVFLTTRRVARLAVGRRGFEARDRVLAYYAPVSLVLLPGVWVALVMIGFTGIFWGTDGGSLRDSFLLSGSSLLTLGTVFRSDLNHAVLTFAEATLGLGMVALLISYLPSIYGAFSRREQLVGMLEVRAGIPPSPAELLVRYTRIGLLDQIDAELLPQWEQWFMDIEESHTTLPALVFFRSPQPERSWITAAGCILDTAALMSSTIDKPHNAVEDLLIRSGFFALRRIADYFTIVYDPAPTADDPIMVTRREFDLVCVELEAAGVPLKPDRDRAWRDFTGWRVNYDSVLVQLAALVDAPPGRWSSDRGPVTPPKPKIWRVGRRRRAAPPSS